MTRDNFDEKTNKFFLLKDIERRSFCPTEYKEKINLFIGCEI
jgi:hypothetical protein